MADERKELTPAAAEIIHGHLKVLVAAGKRFLSLATFGGMALAETKALCHPAVANVIQYETAIAAQDLEWAARVLRDHLQEHSRHPDLRIVRAALAWFMPNLSRVLIRWG